MQALIYNAIVETNTNSTAEMSLKMPDCGKFPTCCHTERRHLPKQESQKNLYTLTQRPRAKFTGVMSMLDFQSIQWGRTGGFECRSEGNDSVSLLLVAHCVFDFYSNQNCRYNKMLVRLNCQT